MKLYVLLTWHMPYIRGRRRIELDRLLRELYEVTDLSVRELNYVITRLLLKYMEHANECYAAYNGLVGVLECCKMELYRRLIATYEDEKMEENGDVYYRVE